MSTTGLSGINLYYEVHGEGPPLVLIAGLASDSQSWLPVIEPLSRRFTVIVYDNRGVGRTAPRDAKISIASLGDDCAALIEHLGYSKVHLLGHSMGGFVAQDVAVRYPNRVDRLILVGTALENAVANDTLLLDMARSLESGTDPEAWFREFFRWIFTARFLQDEAAVAQALQVAVAYPYPQTPAQFRRQVEAVVAFTAVDPRQIRARALVMTGSDDLLFPPDTGQALAAELPDAQFVQVPAGAHSIHMEASDVFVDAVLEFLERR